MVASFTSFLCVPFCQTKNRAMPIKRKSIVQTGPKIQFGGLKEGLCKVAYQVGMDELVKTVPKIPASSDIAMATTNLKKFGNFMCL